VDRIYLDHISGRPVDERVLKDIVIEEQLKNLVLILLNLLMQKKKIG
jgi:hypothetical protein